MKSPRHHKPLPRNWYPGLDLRSRPRFVPELRPLSLTKLMRNRKVSRRNLGVRT